MSQHSIREAQELLPNLIEETAISHQPILITGSHNAVLIAAEDWTAIQETLYLLSIPGMRESIREGLETSIGDCSSEIEW